MKTITEISMQKNNAKRCNLFLDGEFFCGIELITVMQNRLKVGDKISEQKLDEIVISSEREKCMQVGLNYVSKSLKTTAQTKKFLKNKGFLPSVIGEVITKLSEYGYLDDGNFAKSYINAKKLTKGKRLLKTELKLKGVDEDVIDGELENVDGEYEGAFIIAEKFFKNKERTFDNVSKCYRRLLSKGFDYDVCKSVIDKFKTDIEI